MSLEDFQFENNIFIYIPLCLFKFIQDGMLGNNFEVAVRSLSTFKIILKYITKKE